MCGSYILRDRVRNNETGQVQKVRFTKYTKTYTRKKSDVKQKSIQHSIGFACILLVREFNENNNNISSSSGTSNKNDIEGQWKKAGITKWYCNLICWSVEFQLFQFLYFMRIDFSHFEAVKRALKQSIKSEYYSNKTVQQTIQNYTPHKVQHTYRHTHNIIIKVICWVMECEKRNMCQ